MAPICWLASEADDWWLETHQRLKVVGEIITWVVFSREFLRKYFLEDVCGEKEIEILELRQRDLSVTEYAQRFIVELAKFYPHYNKVTAEFSKCIKFENELCLAIKRAIRYQKIRMFLELVDCCRIYEKDSKAHYKAMIDKSGKQQQNCGKPSLTML